MKTIITHSGMFHTDDVFAVATMLMVYPDSKVIRSRNPQKIKEADIVVDVGMECNSESMHFDHHQEGGAGIRPNGIPYASFGLVWKEFGEMLAGIEGRQVIDEKLVMAIDAHDNGVSVIRPVFEGVRQYTISDFLFSFVDYKRTDEEYIDGVFLECVKIAKDIIEREIVRAKDSLEGMKKVREIYEVALDKRILFIGEELPWEQVLSPIDEALFVVYQRKEGTWAAKAIPVSPGSFERKKYFPEAWSGKVDGELAKLSGVESAIFCHRGRFIAVAGNKEDALKMTEMAINS